MIISKKTVVLLGGVDCGKQIRTSCQTILHKSGAYHATNKRDSQGRQVYLWRFEGQEVKS